MTVKAIVIGGSLGGLLAATALRSAGCQVDVYERNETTLEARGAGIRIQTHMRNLLAQRAGIDLSDSMVSLARSRWLEPGPGNTLLADEPFPVHYSSWSTLYRLLLARHGDAHYHLGAAYIDHTETADSVCVRFEDGRTAEGDLLVFADGINSSGRRRLLPGVEPRYAGYVCWRGMVPEQDMSEETAAIFHDAFVLTLQRPGHMGIYAIPGAAGNSERRRLYNYVWYRNVTQGAPFEALMTDREGVYRPMSLPPGMVQDRFVQEMREAAAASLAPAAAELVQKTEKPFVQVIADVEVPQLAFGRACLLGDASFGGRPHLGAATAKAAVNGWALADSLAEHGGDVVRALVAWEHSQLPLGQHYVQAARAIGEKLQFRDDARHDDPAIRRPWPHEELSQVA